jgi:hypothetical protein
MSVSSHSDFDFFRQADGILHIDAKVAHRAFQFAMAGEQPPGAEVAGLLVDECNHGPPYAVRAIIARVETNHRDPFVD